MADAISVRRGDGQLEGMAKQPQDSATSSPPHQSSPAVLAGDTLLRWLLVTRMG
jgi:hypothetical protein